MFRLKFSGTAGPNPIDRQLVIGTPVPRIEGFDKVCGVARYSYDHHQFDDCAVGFVIEAGIARGRISRMDTTEAQRSPGVVHVMTHLNAPAQGKRSDKAFPVLGDDRIRHYGQPVAFVVAETFEQARDAAYLVDVGYERQQGRFSLEEQLPRARVASGTVLPMPAADTDVGDFDTAMRSARWQIDATYGTAPLTHAMMEPYATLARWDGDGLTLWTAHQLFEWAYRDLPHTLLIPPDQLRLISTFVGGGFGGKLYPQADAILSALAARTLGRPVRTALTRSQIMHMTRHGPATVQRLRLGANVDGQLDAIGHDVWYGNADWGGEPELAANQTRLMYAGANRRTRHRHVVLDWPVGSAIRAPGERSGMMALEAAMDELAHQIGLDPVELRIRNDVQYDPEAGPGRPFATNSLVECLRTGADRFGWSSRSATPATVINGRLMMGMGMAAAFRRNQVRPSAARVAIEPSGAVVVESSATDIGTGTYTVMAQTAAEMLGVPVERVEVRLADSRMPAGAGGGGSWGANSATSGLYVACQEARRQLCERAGLEPADTDFVDGMLTSRGRAVPLVDAVAARPVVAEGAIEFGEKDVVEACFGAHFCEVSVDRYTAEVRILRWLTVAEIGRVLNPRTARSQVIGGVTFGIGAALMEECVMDERHGVFVNHDLAGYHMPSHADIPDLDVVFLDKTEPTSSPMKAKGVGELGNCGAGAAVANAVFNATGVRVREYPISVERLLPHLPA